LNIKEKIIASGYRQWEVAEVMQISEFTLSRYLRRPDRMDPAIETRIEKAINELKRQEEKKQCAR
jgi:predicted transcriptional regulator